jgi:intracellular septation protein A
LANILLALLPLVGFYAVEAWWGTRAGIAAGVTLALLDLLVQRARTGAWGRLQLLMVGLVGGLGGLSLASDDERFALWTPAIGDLALAALLAFALARGKNPLADIVAAQQPDLEVHPLQAHFLRGMAARLALNFAAHAAWVATSVDDSREAWLFVSGPGQYLTLGVQFVAEVAWARLVVLPRVEADEAGP